MTTLENPVQLPVVLLYDKMLHDLSLKHNIAQCPRLVDNDIDFTPLGRFPSMMIFLSRNHDV